MRNETQIVGKAVSSGAISRPLRLFALSVAFALAGFAPSGAQVTKHGTLQWIMGACDRALEDNIRQAIAKRGKTVAEVCNCTADDLWRKFPSTEYWHSETTPYDWNKVVEAFPLSVAKCAVE
jgi:hypothetical protein